MEQDHLAADRGLSSPAVASELPVWYPEWARRLAHTYVAGNSCFFLLHGNVHDLVLCERNGTTEFVSLAEFLGEFVFGRWDLVLLHNLSKGLQPLAGSDSDRHQEMMRELSGLMGPYRNWSRDPDNILLSLDQMIERYLVEDDPQRRRRMAVLFDFGQYLVPPGDPVQTSGRIASRVVRFLDWARNPYIRRVNMAFCLIAEGVSEIHERLVSSPYVTTIEIPMPDHEARRRFVHQRQNGVPDTSDAGQQHESADPGTAASATSETAAKTALALNTRMSAAQLVSAANGLSLLSLEQLMAESVRAGGVTAGRFRELKKSAIERQCGGYLEFVEPSHTLNLVVGHEAACRRLREDAELISLGHFQAAPMGYLFCGAVGTGKTFLAECYAGSIGIPCVKLRNFRSKYVGETEGNLQRVLTVLRSLGPVVVIIDEADASLGDRNQEGDSGTGSRVFSMIAQQMGDTRYRGRIIWMLLTSRPDLLPIDLKRQGRAEVHIPLFYPEDDAEIREMFRVMCRKNAVDLDPDALTLQHHPGDLSGADIESVVLSARRRALLENRLTVTNADLNAALQNFIPSAQGLEKDMQELAAVLECTQMDFLNPRWQKELEDNHGRSGLQQRLTQIRNLVESL